jgi:predicted ATP-binding protein involved in virulence
MRIDRLTVKNFKGFESRTFEFPRSIDAVEGGNGSFHLLIGQNGQGKTSALDALAVAAGSWFLGVRAADSRHIQKEDIRVKVLDYRDTQRIEQQLPVVVDATGRIGGTNLSWKRSLVSERTDRIGAKNIKAIAEKTVKSMQSGEPDATLPLIAYYGTGRLWQEPRDMQGVKEQREGLSRPAPRAVGSDGPEEDLATSFSSRLAGYRFSLDPRCSPRDLLRWLRFEQQLAVQDKKESTQFTVVKEAIRRSVESCELVEFHLRLGLLLNIAGQPRLPFGNLSDGQRNMIAMVGDLAYKAAQLNPHLGGNVLSATPGIVMIDELDLHLHPTWQQHIVEDLRALFPEIQFIATTHSPFIVQSMREGELIPLDAQPVQTTAKLGVEAIAEGLMGVKAPHVGQRYQTMVAVAEQYLAALNEAQSAASVQLAAIEEQLAGLISPYADNPAYQAFLNMERIAALGSSNEAR